MSDRGGCAHCPIASPCPGERAVRICHLVDPSHPAYDPRYLETLRIHAERAVRHSGSIPADDADRPPPSEVLAALRVVAACPYRATDPPCGCSGARCGLRRGAIVGHAECLDCVGRYG